jgi:hypothetical protein
VSYEFNFLAFEHNIRAVPLFGSGPVDVAQELGEFHYHIGFMYIIMFFIHSLFSTY